jgi:hypothetical protein
MSRPARDIARDLYELREKTKAQIEQAAADEAEAIDLHRRLLGLFEKYGLANYYIQAINLAPKGFQAEVRLIAEKEAYTIAQSALYSPDGEEPATEVAVDTINRGDMGAGKGGAHGLATPNNRCTFVYSGRRCVLDETHGGQRGACHKLEDLSLMF